MAASSATYKSVQLKFLVDKERKKVVYAEAGKDFVDVLFSFFTFPLGTIVRLLSKESNIQPLSIGSLSSLYQKVIDIDENYLSTLTCKEMLMNPRNSMEDYCLPMKLNIDDSEPVQYFRCKDWFCYTSDSGSPLSTFKNQKCSCGEVMNERVFPSWLNHENGFVKENATFIISDNLNVMPNVFETIVSLLQKFGIENSDSDTIQEQTMDITKKEVIDLLKLSFFSKTPLTDFIFNKNQLLGNLNTRDKSVFDIGKVVSSDDGREMLIKVKLRKSNEEILFAEVEEDFVDFLFSFVTLPLGGLLHMLEGFTLGCLSNLHESMKELNLDRYLVSQDLKDKLVKPKIAPQYDLTNQILPTGTAASLPDYYCHSYYDKYDFGYNVHLRKDMVYLKNTFGISQEKFVRFSFVDPKTSSSKSSTSGGFVKGPSTYMVTKDLVVTPMSYAFAMSYLNRAKVSLFDLEEKVIKIGRKEAICILKAFLVTDNALANCLNQFIGTVKDPVKKEITIKEEN